VPSAVNDSPSTYFKTTLSFAISHDEGQQLQSAILNLHHSNSTWCSSPYAISCGVQFRAESVPSAVNDSPSTYFITFHRELSATTRAQSHKPARTPHKSHYLQASVHPCHQTAPRMPSAIGYSQSQGQRHQHEPQPEHTAYDSIKQTKSAKFATPGYPRKRAHTPIWRALASRGRLQGQNAVFRLIWESHPLCFLDSSRTP